MDFSLPQLFVLKASNTLPSGTNWSALTSKNFGVYKPDYTAATAGNVASQAYIQLVQARPSTLPGVDHKRTDKIYKENVLEWYKITGNSGVIASLTGGTTATSTTVTMASTANVAVGQLVTGTGIPDNTVVLSVTTNTSIVISKAATVTGTPVLSFKNSQISLIKPDVNNMKCGEDYTVSLRLRSFYIDTSFYNGLTRSYTYPGANNCCDCGEDPCTTLTSGDLITMLNWFRDQINADLGKQGAGNYVTASVVEDGVDSYLVVTGKTLATEPLTADRTNFPFQYDRLYFWSFAYKGPALSQDYLVADACDPFATIEQFGEGDSTSATFPFGSSAEIKQLEVDYNSYNTAAIAKKIFRNINFNQAVQDSEVVDGTYYDMYYIKYKNPSRQQWNPIVPQDESAIICNPTGQNSGTIAVLTAFLGTPSDKSI